MTVLNSVLCLLMSASFTLSVARAEEPQLAGKNKDNPPAPQLVTTSSLGAGIVSGDNTNGTHASLGVVELAGNLIQKNSMNHSAVVGDAAFALMLGAAHSKKNGNALGAGFKENFQADYLYAPLASACSPVVGGGVDFGGSLIGAADSSIDEAPMVKQLGAAVRISAGAVCATKSKRAFSLLATTGLGGSDNGNYNILSLRGKYLINANLAVTAAATKKDTTQENDNHYGYKIQSVDRLLVGGIQLLNPANHTYLGVEAGVSDNETKDFYAGTSQSSTGKILSITGGFAFQ